MRLFCCQELLRNLSPFTRAAVGYHGDRRKELKITESSVVCETMDAEQSFDADTGIYTVGMRTTAEGGSRAQRIRAIFTRSETA